MTPSIPLTLSPFPLTPLQFPLTQSRFQQFFYHFPSLTSRTSRSTA